MWCLLHASGLGDRLRGILMFLRAAAASKRVLLIDIAYPVDMHDFFMPSLIDWSVGELELPRSEFPWKAGDEDNRELLMKTNAPLGLATQFLVIQGQRQCCTLLQIHDCIDEKLRKLTEKVWNQPTNLWPRNKVRWCTSDNMWQNWLMNMTLQVPVAVLEPDCLSNVVTD